MWPCDQSFVIVAFFREKLFDRCFSFKFNNLKVALGMTFTFYTSVAKRLKLKLRKFLGLIIPTFLEVTEENLVEGTFGFPILNRINGNYSIKEKFKTILIYWWFFQSSIFKFDLNFRLLMFYMVSQF